MDNSLIIDKKMYKKKLSKKDIIKTAVSYVVLVLLGFFFIFPYFIMVTKSFMTFSEVNSATVNLFPEKLQWSNYKIFIDYIYYYKNTVTVILINGFFIPLTGAMIAFPFARYKFKGKKIMFALLLSTVMLPGSVTQIPVYVLFDGLGLVNKLSSQWIGAFFGGGAMGIYLIVQFMRAIPKEFDDAAYIDGANKFMIFNKIMLPLCFNILLYTAICVIIGKWNDFTGPLIYLRSESNFTLAVAFYYKFSSSGTDTLFVNYKMAMAATMTLLPMILFFFFQKQMIGGVKIGGIKG